MFDDIFEGIEIDSIMSEEIIHLDRALEESKKIQSSLESSINHVEKLKSKHEASAQSYFYNFTTSKKLSHSCVRAEYLMFSIYDIHLSNLCQKLDFYSPQHHQRNSSFSSSPLHHNHRPKVRKIHFATTTTPSTCSSSAQSTSSTELINQLGEDSIFDEKYRPMRRLRASNGHGDGPDSGYRTHKDLLRIYNRAKTDRIKGKREIEGALMSLDKALAISTNRAQESRNYAWFQEKMRTPIKRNLFAMMAARRSISTSLCRVRPHHSTPIHIMKRPLSTSVIF